MNLPNKLTIFRIVLVPIIVLFLLCDCVSYRYVFAFLTFLVASYTDHIDGKIARKSGKITNFGKFADPLADKILIISCLVCLLNSGLVDVITTLIIIAREFIVTSIRLVAVEQGKVISANMWGKLKTVSQVVAVLSVIGMQAFKECVMAFGYGLNIEMYGTVSNTIGQIIICISAILTVISGIIYVYENRKIIKEVG